MVITLINSRKCTLSLGSFLISSIPAPKPSRFPQNWAKFNSLKPSSPQITIRCSFDEWESMRDKIDTKIVVLGGMRKDSWWNRVWLQLRNKHPSERGIKGDYNKSLESLTNIRLPRDNTQKSQMHWSTGATKESCNQSSPLYKSNKEMGMICNKVDRKKKQKYSLLREL